MIRLPVAFLNFSILSHSRFFFWPFARLSPNYVYQTRQLVRPFVCPAVLLHPSGTPRILRMMIIRRQLGIDN